MRRVRGLYTLDFTKIKKYMVTIEPKTNNYKSNYVTRKVTIT